MSEENKNNVIGLSEAQANTEPISHKDESPDASLDRPLVVHHTDDASYIENTAQSEMSLTHNERELDENVLERHRFKKKKKKSKAPLIILFVVVIVAAVIAGLYFSGTIGNFSNKEQTQTTTKKSYTTEQANQFLGTVTVKGTYIFYEGNEVEGIEGLTKNIKYLDKGTKLIVQDENADSNFLNLEVLSLLSDYGIDYEITHIVSSGLMSKYETTAPPADTTVVPPADTTVVPPADTTAAPPADTTVAPPADTTAAPAV